ncbi:acyl-CoA N-acyltransferase [Coniochaeta sp. 2T2.1]|nr:acyl-CoA N-acyltransferase [Coniochaeta sp. 2T2.1]
MDNNDYDFTVLRATRALRTRRLGFKALQPHDWAFFLDQTEQDPATFALQDPDLFRPPGSLMRREEFLQVASGPLAVLIYLRTDLRPIGILTLSESKERDRSQFSHRNRSSLRLSIVIGIDHKGHGYGTEAIKWALDWAFKQAGVHTVSAEAFGYNAPAMRVCEKAGFVREGRLRERHFWDGRWWDIVLFSRTDLD